MVRFNNLKKINETVKFKSKIEKKEKSFFKPGLYNLIQSFKRNSQNPKFLPEIEDLTKLYKSLDLI